MAGCMEFGLGRKANTESSLGLRKLSASSLELISRLGEFQASRNPRRYQLRAFLSYQSTATTPTLEDVGYRVL
jgi:hypothetical protein